MAHNKMIRLVLLMAGLCLITTPATADEEQFARMPWHLVDLWWDVGDDTPLESYSVEVTISDDIPSTKNLYIAPIGLGHLSKTPFYGGIQSQADGCTKQNQQLRKIGPGFLMSMWGERSLDAIRPSLGGFCQSSGHEGDFVSIRRPYEWTKGTYTYKIARMDKPSWLCLLAFVFFIFTYLLVFDGPSSEKSRLFSACPFLRHLVGQRHF